MANKMGVGLIAMKPHAGGKLADSTPFYKKRKFSQGESLAQVALRYVLLNKNITCAIPGMMELNELNENLQVGKQERKLTIKEIKMLMEFVGEAGKGFCRNCGYCLPCPQGISIPDIFRFESYYEKYGLKEWAIEQYRSLEIKADVCSACDECLELCPYSVPITKRLKFAHEILQ